MKIKIERQNRKTIVLKIVDEDNVLLKVPYFLSESKIDEFLDSKRIWIENHVKKLKQKSSTIAKLDLKNKLYLMGEYFGNVEDIKSKSKDRIKNFYKSKFYMIEDIARQLSTATGLKFKEIKLHSSVCVWGSFNTDAVMKINWKLIILPEQLIRYVIVHELCHSKQMNHSAKFWALVEKFCPEYKKLRKQLNEFSFLLKEKF